MGDIRILLTLPKVEQPAWWAGSDRQCWYTLRELLQRTATVATTTR